MLQTEELSEPLDTLRNGRQSTFLNRVHRRSCGLMRYVSGNCAAGRGVELEEDKESATTMDDGGDQHSQSGALHC